MYSNIDLITLSTSYCSLLMYVHLCSDLKTQLQSQHRRGMEAGDTAWPHLARGERGEMLLMYKVE